MLTYPQTFPLVFFTGQPVSPLVPAMWPAALGGRTYMLDTANERWRHASIALLRPQTDDSTAPSERSLNPDALWRRSADSWHGGAGQTFRDRAGGDETRFRSSKGLDGWTPYELSLLNDTDQKTSDANTNLFLQVAGSRLYTSTNQSLKFTTDVTAGTPTFTDCTGEAAATVTGLASDGKYVYLGQGASGIYLTNTGTAAAASWITGTVEKVWFVKGRLMTAAGAAIYNVVTSTATAGPTALPAAHFTQRNDGFTWVGMAEGKTAIYAAGFVGDKSLIYRIGVLDDGTALAAPIIAGELPDGEIIRGIGGYLGFIFLGTDKGVRFCEVDSTGNLNIGAPFGPTGVRCFEGQDRFVWFGWTNYDGTSTGLGRLDLRTFTEDTVTGARQPAYSSDLMVTAQGTVLELATFQDIRVFTVSGSGVWAEDTASLVSSGTMDTGEIGFGIPDEKIALLADVRTLPLNGSYQVSLSTDDGPWVVLGVESDADDIVSEFPIADGSGQQFELRIVLTRGSPVTDGPVVTRWTLKATPGGTDSPAEFLFIPILLHETVRLPGGQNVAVDVAFEREVLKGLRRSRRLVVYQEAETTYEVQAENFEWQPINFGTNAQGSVTSANGTMLMQLKRVGS